MVAYTSNAAALAGDPTSRALLAINLANESYARSSVKVALDLAGGKALVVDFDETGSFESDVAALRNPTDGKLDGIHKQRDNLKADVVVLFVANQAYCGIADEIRAKAPTAFALVWDGCIENQSFAHEIGHLQGARHNPEADDTATPFPHGHGYCNVEQSKRTIMSYECGGLARSLRWSTPVDEWGTAATHDNARVLNDTAPAVAGFRN